MRWLIVPVILLSWLAVVASPPASAARAARPQEPTSQGQPGQAIATAPAPTPRKEVAKTVRLPRYFGQLGLDDQQRTQVRQVEQSYKSRSQQLLAELKKLRADRDQQLASLLTTTQQKKFEGLLARRGNRAAKKMSVPGKPAPTKSVAATPQS